MLLPLILGAGISLAWPAPASGQNTDCGPRASAGEQVVALTYEGRSRPVLVYVPKSYDPCRASPLLLNLHGSGSNGKAQFALSGLAAEAERLGVIIASPDGGIASGDGFLWNVPGVPTVDGTIPGRDAPDDTGYLVEVVDVVARRLRIDKDRVYSTGLSGGGRMSSWLACARANRFAAIAPVVGLRAGRARPDDMTEVDQAHCRPSRPVPIIAFAGALDRTNPIEGGEGPRWGYSMAAAMQRWAALNGCPVAEPTVWVGPTRYRQRYGTCANGGRVEAVVDSQGKHDWSVANNREMLDFLLQHALK